MQNVPQEERRRIRTKPGQQGGIAAINMDKGNCNKKSQGRHQLIKENPKSLPGYLVRRILNHQGICYMNAMLQNLFSIDVLRNYFIHSVDDSFGPLTSSLRNLFLQTIQYVIPHRSTRINNGAIDPTPLFKIMCDKFPESYGLHQSGLSIYFLKDLISVLSSEELNRGGVASKPRPAFVDTIFSIELTTTCSVCGSSNDQTIHDIILFVPHLPKANRPNTIQYDPRLMNVSRHKHMHTILKLADSKKVSAKSARSTRATTAQCTRSINPNDDDSIESRLHLDMTDRCHICPKYAESNVMRQNRITKAPHILMITMDYTMFDRDKLEYNGRRVKYGETLDIKPYMDPSCIDRDDTYKYRLTGLIEGTMIGCKGHCFAFVRGINTKCKWSWYVADDNAMTRKIPVDEVLARKPDMLFYEKI